MNSLNEAHSSHAHASHKAISKGLFCQDERHRLNLTQETGKYHNCLVRKDNPVYVWHEFWTSLNLAQSAHGHNRKPIFHTVNSFNS